MKRTEQLKDNLTKLQSLVDFYQELMSQKYDQPKAEEKLEFKKRYLKDKILSLCIDNKKLLRLIQQGR